MNPQLALFDAPEPPAPKRKRQPVAKPPVEETIHQTLARYAKEAAEIRERLKAEGKI